MNMPQPILSTPSLSTPSLSTPSLYAPESFLSVSEPFLSVPEPLVSDLPVARTGGFTLTRLLLVIAIVGTLSALAAPALFSIQP